MTGGWKTFSFHLEGLVCVLQHAPYDAMVLVSLCWYLDQQIKATGGVWKVPAVVSCSKKKQKTKVKSLVAFLLTL